MSKGMEFPCGGREHLWRRRTLLKAAGAAWLTPVAELLARQSEREPRAPAKSIIVLWLAGGPSQLETFDPHPGGKIGGDATAIKTAAPGVRLAGGMEPVAELMDSIALVRSVVSKEGDHERATYNVKTGFRPDPTLVHPSIGAVACHELKDRVEIPRHISILPGPWPARGGYLGDQFDAFKIGDPQQPVPDVESRVSKQRLNSRRLALDEVEREFARGRIAQLDLRKTLHRKSIEQALQMMSSDQLSAFDVSGEPKAVREQFGDNRFGRGCLAAVRLIGVGVRCVEVTLGGWDSHIDNHSIQSSRVGELAPALAATVKELKNRGLLEHTIVLCGGEFGRTPTINPLEGRDHWPHGFSVALAGGGIRGGRVVGETAAEPKLDPKNRMQDVSDPHNISDIHATVLSQLGIDFEKELDTPVGRPMVISKGAVIKSLVS